MKNINENMIFSSKGLEMLKRLEGLGDGDKTTAKLEPYVCSSGYWTIGYGHLLRIMGERLHKNIWKANEIKTVFGSLKNENEANEILRRDIARYEEHVKKTINVPLSQNEFDALVIFSFNCWYSETIWNSINNKKPVWELSVWWSTHWCSCNGKVSKGLLKRRAEEALLYVSGYYS